MQIADTVLMVRPAAFAFNAETAANNFFQNRPDIPLDQLQQNVLAQFDAMVSRLQAHGIEVLVVDDSADPPKPDAIFPNNWFCAANNSVSIFPMFAPSRRSERRADVVRMLSERFVVEDVHDWTGLEQQGLYLEGTGSMVIDHEARIVYACLSPRTHRAVAEKFAAANGYRVLAFTASDEYERPIYHTNVMMCIGEGFAVFCPKAIIDHTERIAVAQLLEATGHENIYITYHQMNAFAANMLHLKNKQGKKFIVLSSTALESLTQEQVEKLQRFGQLLPVDVSIIEQIEGGSARCMMAEIFLQPRT